MAFTATTTDSTSMSEILKRVFAPWLVEALNNSWRPLKRLQGKAHGVSKGGTGLYWPVRYGRPHARAGGESAALPVATSSQDQQASETPSKQYTTVQWSDFHIRNSKTKSHAWAREIQSEMEAHKKAMMASVCRQVMGTGDGIVAYLNAANNALNPDLYLRATVGATEKGGASMFEVGNYIKVCNAQTLNTTRHTASTPLRVTEVDLQNNKIGTTGDTTASTAADDAVIIYGSQVSGSTYETVGLQQICDATSTLHGLAPGTYKWWKGTVVENGAAISALDLNKLRELIDHIVTRGGKPTCLYMSFGVRRALISLLQARQRYVDKMKIDGGVEVEAFTHSEGSIPILADRWCPKNKILAPCEDDLLWSQLGGKPHWLEDQGGSVVHLKSGYPIFESVLAWYPQLGCRRRDIQGQLTNVEEE